MFSKIVHVHTTLRPGGGPQGYLFNLKKICEEKKSSAVTVRAIEVDRTRSTGGARFSILPAWFQRNTRPLKQVFNMLGLLPCGLEDFLGHKEEAICVHLAPYAARLLRKRRSGQAIFFMPHGPISYSDELMNEIDLRYGVGIFSGFYRKILNHLESRLFGSVDGVVVACRQGLDAYFRGVLPDCEIFEVLSGVPTFENTVDKQMAREALNLPAAIKVIGYFGRFNADKGFDLFLNAIQEMGQRSDVIFISAGAGPLEPIEFPSYINYGWRSDIHVLMSACDAIVLPNRVTYFDLLPLEAMSIGRPVIASKVGGNVKLAEIADTVELFELEIDDFVSKLDAFILRSTSECKKLEARTRDLYLANFSIDIFYDNHVYLFKQINKRSWC